MWDLRSKGTQGGQGWLAGGGGGGVGVEEAVAGAEAARRQAPGHGQLRGPEPKPWLLRQAFEHVPGPGGVLEGRHSVCPAPHSQALSSFEPRPRHSQRCPPHHLGLGRRAL